VDAWVNIAIPVASVYFAADYELRLHLLTLALVVALALTAAWFGSEVVVLRNVRALVQAAQKIKDGELGVRTGIRPGADELGQLSGLFDEMAVALQQRDTERLRAAVALRRSRDQLEGLVQERAQELGNERDLLRSLVDNLPDYVYVKGVDGRYIVDNATHRSLLGVGTSEEVVGRTAFDFFPAELAERYQADDRAVFETGLPLFNREEQVADRSGRRLLIATTKVPLRDKAGKVIGLVGVGRDITARRQEALAAAALSAVDGCGGNWCATLRVNRSPFPLCPPPHPRHGWRSQPLPPGWPWPPRQASGRQWRCHRRPRHRILPAPRWGCDAVWHWPGTGTCLVRPT
jgi:PAS domain S-box-containing protein